MSEKPKTLLITGPTGSGKSSLAQNIAGKLGWTYLSEDDYWTQNDWGSGPRTSEQERIVQEQVTSELVSATRRGQNVVLEFILYKEPPNPLTTYQAALSDNSIKFGTIALAPSVDEILKRLDMRGRPDDLGDPVERRRNVEYQVSVVRSEAINPEWIVDPTNMTIDALGEICINKIPD